MAVTLSLYNHVGEMLGNAGIDWNSLGITVNCQLTLDYTFAATHKALSELGATTVGSPVAVTSRATSRTNALTKFSSDPVVFLNQSLTFDGAIIYLSGSYSDSGGATITNPVIAFVSFDGGTNISVTNEDVSLLFNTDGIFTLGA